MKLIITSIEGHYLKHEEVELPERFLDLSIELDSGPIFQVNVSDDEQVLTLREKTYRHLALFPESANAITIKGL
jgi:hypothetical protein